MAEGKLPLALRGARVLALDHMALLGGTIYRGQYEERLQAIVAEVSAAPDVILFIDELHNLIGQGTAVGAAMDAANMLKPALVRGDFRVIGATTDEEYNHWVAGDPALERRFQKVTVRELGIADTLDILRARKERLERHHNVIIADEALSAAVDLTDRYVTDRRRPDKAIDALDEACAHTQAIARYPQRAEELIRDRIKKLREHHALPRRQAQAKPDRELKLEDDDWDRMAEKGMDALERFGAGLESIFAGAPVGAPGTPATPTAQTPPAASATPEPVVTLGQLDTELAHVLAAEGIVVRAHDVARVVSLMTGKDVVWESAKV